MEAINDPDAIRMGGETASFGTVKMNRPGSLTMKGRCPDCGTYDMHPRD